MYPPGFSEFTFGEIRAVFRGRNLKKATSETRPRVSVKSVNLQNCVARGALASVARGRLGAREDGV